MHNLTPTQIDELLKLIANGVKSYRNGNGGFSEAQIIMSWMQQNAPEYLK